MVLAYAPACACEGFGVCWDLTLAGIVQRSAVGTADWGPLRVDETTLVFVSGGFRDLDYIEDRARQVLRALDAAACPHGEGRGLDCAIGIGLYPNDGDRAEELIACASAALEALCGLGIDAARSNTQRARVCRLAAVRPHAPVPAVFPLGARRGHHEARESAFSGAGDAVRLALPGDR
jgi:hypothetical protein